MTFFLHCQIFRLISLLSNLADFVLQSLYHVWKYSGVKINRYLQLYKQNLRIDSLIRGRIMCKSIGSMSQLETRPPIGWPARSTNQRPGFQLNYVSNWLILPIDLHMIRPLVYRLMVKSSLRTCLDTYEADPAVTEKNSIYDSEDYAQAFLQVCS